MTSIDINETSLSREELELRRECQQSLSLQEKDRNSEVVDDQHRLKLIVIGSGSKGNAAVVVDRLSGDGVLIDCGICKRDVFAYSEQGGFDLHNLKAILISHAHSDHVKNFGPIWRGLVKLGIEPPVYAHGETIAASKVLAEMQASVPFCHMKKGETLDSGGLQVSVLETSHDTDVSFAFKFRAGSDSLGFMTDTGIVPPETLEALKGVRILGIESNHDLHMLKVGPYPAMLKERVGSSEGHLSNVQAAEALKALLSEQLETVVALHISENNNTYRLPVETLRSVVQASGFRAQVTCAYQSRPVFIS